MRSIELEGRMGAMAPRTPRVTPVMMVRASRLAASLRSTRPSPGDLDSKPPLTPEYQEVLEDSMVDQANGGEGNFFDRAVRCMPGGMPLMTIAFNVEAPSSRSRRGHWGSTDCRVIPPPPDAQSAAARPG